MKDRITIEGRNGEFGANIARQKIVPAPAVVVLHEVFGVNADIRKTCDELAEQGVIAVAPSMVGCLVRPTEPSGRRRRGSSHAPFRLFAVGVSHELRRLAIRWRSPSPYLSALLLAEPGAVVAASLQGSAASL